MLNLKVILLSRTSCNPWKYKKTGFRRVVDGLILSTFEFLFLITTRCPQSTDHHEEKGRALLDERMRWPLPLFFQWKVEQRKQ